MIAVQVEGEGEAEAEAETEGETEGEGKKGEGERGGRGFGSNDSPDVHPSVQAIYQRLEIQLDFVRSELRQLPLPRELLQIIFGYAAYSPVATPGLGDDVGVKIMECGPRGMVLGFGGKPYWGFLQSIMCVAMPIWLHVDGTRWPASVYWKLVTPTRVTSHWRAALQPLKGFLYITTTWLLALFGWIPCFFSNGHTQIRIDPLSQRVVCRRHYHPFPSLLGWENLVDLDLQQTKRCKAVVNTTQRRDNSGSVRTVHKDYILFSGNRFGGSVLAPHRSAALRVSRLYHLWFLLLQSKPTNTQTDFLTHDQCSAINICLDRIDALKPLSSLVGGHSLASDSMVFYSSLIGEIFTDTNGPLPVRDTRAEVTWANLAVVTYLATATGVLSLLYRSFQKPKCSQWGLLGFVSASLWLGGRLEDSSGRAFRRSVDAQVSSLVESMSWGRNA